MQVFKVISGKCRFFRTHENPLREFLSNENDWKERECSKFKLEIWRNCCWIVENVLCNARGDAVLSDSDGDVS
jgi:hypothetical protein